MKIKFSTFSSSWNCNCWKFWSCWNIQQLFIGLAAGLGTKAQRRLMDVGHWGGLPRRHRLHHVALHRFIGLPLPHHAGRGQTGHLCRIADCRNCWVSDFKEDVENLLKKTISYSNHLSGNLDKCFFFAWKFTKNSFSNLYLCVSISTAILTIWKLYSW